MTAAATMDGVLAGIPYQTFPDFELGPLTVRTFGLLVGLGVLVGAYVAARDLERWGVARDDTYKLATRMVIWGIIGSRVTWVLSHLDQIDSPLDTIALWEGGIQFSGGFIAAVIVGYPTFRTWPGVQKWRNLDGYAYGLTIGLAIGRIGCYSVGEHFGRFTDFALGTTYKGGGLQEPTIDGVRIVEGMTFHNTSLYELVHLAVLFLIMSIWRRRHPPAGTLIGLFTVWYALARFFTDTVRVNDNKVLGLTGAQWMCLVLVGFGLWVLLKKRQQVEAAGVASGEPTTSLDGASPATSSDEAGAPESASAGALGADDVTEVDADGGSRS